MKRYFFSLVCLLSGMVFLNAQTSDIVNQVADSLAKTTPAAWGVLDYNISQAPVFSLLSNAPDNMIVPASAKDFDFTTANLNSFAVEVSPFLFAPEISLDEYKKNRFLYRMRFSVGTSFSDGHLQVAEGLRFTLWDKTDLRTDNKYRNQMEKLLGKELANEMAMIDSFFVSQKIDSLTTREKLTIIFRDKDTTKLSDNDKKLYVAYKKYIADKENVAYNDAKNLLTSETYRQQRKEELWNAYIWETGVSAMHESVSEETNEHKIRKAELWSSIGGPIGKNAQWLASGKFQLRTDSLYNWHKFYALGARLSFGQYAQRGFFQLQYEYGKEFANNFSISAGTIYKISEGLWTQLSAALVYDIFTKTLYFEPRFNIGFGNKEKRK